MCQQGNFTYPRRRWLGIPIHVPSHGPIRVWMWTGRAAGRHSGAAGLGWGGVGGNGGKGELVQATAASTPDGCWHGRSLLSLQFLLHPAPRCSQQGWIDCTGL